MNVRGDFLKFPHSTNTTALICKSRNLSMSNMCSFGNQLFFSIEDLFLINSHSGFLSPNRRFKKEMSQRRAARCVRSVTDMHVIQTCNGTFGWETQEARKENCNLLVSTRS